MPVRKLMQLIVVCAAAIVLVAGVFFITLDSSWAEDASEYQMKFPLGIPVSLWKILVPQDSSMSEAKVELGKQLYFDKRLSVDDSVSCATCHDPKLAFTDGKPVSEGVQGKKGARNAPTILNSMFNVEQFWDGRAKTLEDQAKGPVINPLEMAMPSHDDLVKKLQAIQEYQKKFVEVFGAEGITIDNIVRAIASFERTQLSGDSSFDRFQAGDQDAIDESAKRGFDLFKGKARCITCHEVNPTNAFFHRPTPTVGLLRDSRCTN